MSHSEPIWERDFSAMLSTPAANSDHISLSPTSFQSMILTIKIIRRVCKAELGEPWNPPCFCFYGNDSLGIPRLCSVFLSGSVCLTKKSKPLSNIQLGGAKLYSSVLLLYSIFHVFIHRKGTVWALARHCPKPDEEGPHIRVRGEFSYQSHIHYLASLLQLAIRPQISANCEEDIFSQ